jgi:hypothetical protein
MIGRPLRGDVAQDRRDQVAYSEDRKGEHPRQHLKNFTGALQADAYARFHHLYGTGRIYEVACWAHAKRKFYEIHAIHPSPTTI